MHAGKLLARRPAAVVSVWQSLAGALLRPRATLDRRLSRSGFLVMDLIAAGADELTEELVAGVRVGGRRPRRPTALALLRGLPGVDPRVLRSPSCSWCSCRKATAKRCELACAQGIGVRDQRPEVLADVPGTLPAPKVPVAAGPTAVEIGMRRATTRSRGGIGVVVRDLGSQRRRLLEAPHFDDVLLAGLASLAERLLSL